ncbi:DUF262 domain-containing protein [Flavobacterium johnsoniae]|uniref:DUF262 domain-containing protein n=1 Tax=Flavobacterium johnsoniae TaxID=986 RepID=UPI003D96176F
MADKKLQSLLEIFNEKFFRIPDFQRGYSWEKPQLDDFWEDIINLKENKIHYTGLITVEEIKKKDIVAKEKWENDFWLFDRGMSAYYLVDGQQRLTTSIILIQTILERFTDDEGINFNTKKYWENKFLFQSYGEDYKSYVFGYEKDNPSDEFFKTKILRQKSSSSDKVPEQTLYTVNLSFAKKYFESKFEKLENENLEEIFKKVTSRLKFNFYEIDEDLDVFVTFETMNNRGKSLSNLELLKNRLIYLTTLLDIDVLLQNRLRNDINESWKTIYEYLGKNKFRKMDDDEFLRNHWIMFFKYDRSEADSYAKFLLHEKFTSANVLKNKIHFKDIKNYIDSLSESVKSWFYLFNPQFSDYSDETKEWLQKLNRLSMSAFPPLIMAAINKCDENKFLPLLKSAEKFIFLVFRVTQRPSNTKNSHFYRSANSFYFHENPEEQINHVINNINWLCQGESGEGESYVYHGWFDLNKFQLHIHDLFEKSHGFYSWNGLKYFLYEYELHLQEKARGNQKISWFDFNKRRKEDTIEHIYPQTPIDKCWTDNFNFKGKNRNLILHSLGNLVLLAHSKNSELQNKCYEYKSKHEKDGTLTGFFNGSYSEIEVSSYNKWLPSSIENRSLRMLAFMEERWNIKFDEWNYVDKDSLLKLDFLKIKVEDSVTQV